MRWIGLPLICLALGACASAEVTAAPIVAAAATSAFGAVAARLKGKSEEIRALSGAIRIDVSKGGRLSETRVIDPTTGGLSTDGRRPDAILSISEDGLRGLLAGEGDPMELMARGELGIEGDLGLLMEGVKLLLPQQEAPVDRASYFERNAARSAARIALFDRWGATFPNGRGYRTMPTISAVLTGKPRWPVREQYIVTRVGAHHVVATDGLTDDPLFPSDPDSFGIEVWAETDEPLANVVSSWLHSLVETVGYCVAAGDLQASWFEGEPGCVSFEIPTSDLSFFEGAAVPSAWPAAWVTERDTIAMLIGVRNPDRPDRLADPFAAIRYLNVRVITPRELDEILAGGTPAALRIAAAGGTTSRLTSRTP